MLRTTLINTTSPALKTCSASAFSAFSSVSAPATRRAFLLGNLEQQNFFASCRAISTSSIVHLDALSKKQSHKDASPVHRQEKLESSTSKLVKHNGTVPASKAPDMVRGDWVLFHPVYSKDEIKAVQVLHREGATVGDKVAYGMVKLAKNIFDFVSGYNHIETPPSPGMSLEDLRKAGYLLSEKQWLDRILFLETIAGCPGMVAATIRHLQSLRLMRRDSGWIHTCLEEAENERMHLMTFMTLRQPSLLFRLIILGAQGVYYNLFFFSYLISPRVCHRFVGYLEEEAVSTYTRCIADLEAGRIPEWTNKPAPEIAIDYWRLPQDAKLLDVIYAVRSDETTHRFVNHSLANLDHYTDVNPFALREPNMLVKGQKIEFQRSESEEYVKQSHEIMTKQRVKAAEAS